MERIRVSCSPEKKTIISISADTVPQDCSRTTGLWDYGELGQGLVCQIALGARVNHNHNNSMNSGDQNFRIVHTIASLILC